MFVRSAPRVTKEIDSSDIKRYKSINKNWITRDLRITSLLVKMHFSSSGRLQDLVSSYAAWVTKIFLDSPCSTTEWSLEITSRDLYSSVFWKCLHFDHAWTAVRSIIISAEQHFAASHSLPLWTPAPSRVYIAQIKSKKIHRAARDRLLSHNDSFNLIRDFLLGRSLANTAADLSGWNWFHAHCLQLMSLSWSSISCSKIKPHAHDPASIQPRKSMRFEFIGCPPSAHLCRPM